MILHSDFERLFGEVCGGDGYARLVDALGQPSPLSIRVNPRKLVYVPSSESHSLLSPVPWAEDGFYVSSARPTFGADPLWHSGGYYVQEPGSMFVSAFVRASGIAPRVALDLCAAPGGKTTLLRSTLPDDCLLIANEPDGSRATVLKENVLRYGADRMVLTSAYPKDLVTSGLMVDMILVDAPCSGEGMFRKEENAIRDWSLSNVQMCSERQRGILDEAWRMLRPGGLLIYSTCTYNMYENDHQLNYLKETYDVEILHPQVPDGCDVLVRDGVYRFVPSRVQSEGFTIFGVLKGDGQNGSHPRLKLGKEKTKLPGLLGEVMGDEKDNLYQYDNMWYHLPTDGIALLKSFESTKGIRLLLGGVPLGEVKGSDLIPHHGWAMSPALRGRMPFPRVSLDAEQALAYLKRDTLILDHYKGIQTVEFGGLPIGLLKNLGNRTNTLFPKEMSIKNQNISVEDIPNWRGELVTLE